MTPTVRPPEMNGGQVSGTQSITRAFAVLDLFREDPGNLGVVQIAETLGLSLSTAHRIARALVAEGYLAQDDGRERYRLGPQALLLGQAAQRALGMDAARTILRELANHTGESVNLGLLAGDHVVVVERVESPQPLRFSMEVGTRVELYTTSMGKSLLAFNSDLQAYLGGLGDTLVQLTPKTHATASALGKDLAKVKLQGWSSDDEESMLGVRCVAAPILDARGRARAAIAIQAPAVRMPDERFGALGPEVMKAAYDLTRILPL